MWKSHPRNVHEFKLALCLYKLYNVEFNSIEFVSLNNNQILTSRQVKFITIKINTFKVGINSLANRLHSINNSIPLNWLNLSIDTYKIPCKANFIKFWRRKRLIDKDQPYWLLCYDYLLFNLLLLRQCNLFIILLF